MLVLNTPGLGGTTEMSSRGKHDLDASQNGKNGNICKEWTLHDAAGKRVGL